MNFTSIAKLKARIISILDSILIRYSSSEEALYALDESKLEDIVYLLQDAIVEKEKIVEAVKQTQANWGDSGKNRIVLPKPMEGMEEGSKLIEIVNSSKLLVHQLAPQAQKAKTKQPQTSLTITTAYEFPSETLKRFSSITQIFRDKFIIAGGCFYSNPTIKCPNVYIFETEGGTMRKIGELLEPLSSHACVYVPPKVYFIGGKKNEGIITKMCSCFHIHLKQTVEIAALNYSSASLTAMAWKNTHIYKIGGLGQCFGQWSISPYLERYTIEENEWELINPAISEGLLGSFGQFQLYAHSMAYVGQQQEIVIFGGFGADRKGTAFGAVIKVKQSAGQQEDQLEQESNEEEVHQITNFGEVQGLEPGGFWSSSFLTHKNSIITLQTTLNPNLTTKPISLLTK